MNKIKIFTLVPILCILIMIPVSFASSDDAAVDNLTVEGDSSNLLTADYYFDLNATDDSGNGSADNPYKYFKSSRISSNSNLYLAAGEYSLDRSATVKNVTIIGSGASQTILRYSGVGFTVSSSLTLKDITLVNLRITNNGNLTASNVVFRDYSSTPSNGGAIESSTAGAHIVLDNCTFDNIKAKYGGAIYLKQGSLTAENSLFNNTHSELYGGAIAVEGTSEVTINDSQFINSYSLNDAGGAIYLFDSSLAANNLVICNCSSLFGGAITSLRGFLDLTNFTGKNNRAKYDGGAVYALYRSFHMSDSLLFNNSAQNAGAVYVYNVDDFLIQTTNFTDNQATGTAEAFYSIYLQEPYYDSILDDALHNYFSPNTTNCVVEAELPNVFIGSKDYELFTIDDIEITEIPASYDLRNLSQVTSVKYQGSNGNCWAFGALGALESSILKSGGGAYDLSEENMKDLMARYSPYGWDMTTNDGGYSKMEYSYLVSWLGPVNESDDPYKINCVLSPVLNSVTHVQNIIFLKRENFTDNDGIKMAIMKYGGVETSLYVTYNKYQYYSGTNSANHVGVIVGWDDDMTIPDAPDKGAWIVKNSWSTSWGDKGYFYVSYYDTKFAETGSYASYVIVLNDTIKYDKNYQYDIPGITDYFFINQDVVWYKNKFTATENEYLSAVSTYFKKDTQWELSITVNGKSRLNQSGSAESSYMTIELDKFIHLNKGDVFEIAFKITVDSEVAVPISEIVSYNTEFYSPNVSFISFNGKTWNDLYNLTWSFPSHTYDSQVACIKAFTIYDKPKTKIEIGVSESHNPVQLNATVKNEYGNIIKSGNVTFTVEGNDYSVAISNGAAILNHEFKTLGNNTVQASFSHQNYHSSHAETYVVVEKSRDYVILTVPASSTYSYGANKYITATLTDMNGTPIRSKPIFVQIGSETVSFKTTDSSGQIKFSTKSLLPGTHTVQFIFRGDSKLNPANSSCLVTITKLNSNIAFLTTVVDSQNSYITAVLKSSNGDAIHRVNVVLNIAGKSYTNATDSNGTVYFMCGDLASGTYSATVSYGGSNIYNPASKTSNVVVKADLNVSVIYDYTTDEITATFINAETGKAITSANVVVTVNGSSYALKTNTKGQVTVSTADLDKGSYTATVSYAGNSKYNPASASIDFKVRTNILISAKYSADDYELTATMTNADTGKAVVNAKVKINLKGKNYSLTTNSKGQVKLSTEGLPLGTYVATVSYAGNSKYNPASATANVVIRTDVIISDVYGSSDELVAKMTNSVTGKGISGAKVTVTIGEDTYSLKTDSKGRITVSTPGLDSYTAAISYAGNTKYNPASKTVSVDLSKANMIIEASDVSVEYNSNGELVATLTNSITGKPVVSASIVIYVNGASYSAKSDSNGVVRFSCNNLLPETYVATISYAGNSKYNPSSTTAKITVTKLNLVISTAYDDNTKELTAILKNAESGKEISSANLVVELNGVTATYKTDSHGKITVSTSGLTPGNYAAAISYAGNTKYEATATTANIIVK